MKFEPFITKCQKMYNIFDVEGETMDEDSKIYILLKLDERSNLQKSIEVLKYQTETYLSGTVSYKTSANHLSTYFYDLPE